MRPLRSFAGSSCGCLWLDANAALGLFAAITLSHLLVDTPLITKILAIR